MSSPSQYMGLLYLEAGFYGVYLVTFSVAVVYTGRKALQSRLHATLVALITFLFLSSSVNFIIDVYSTRKLLIHDVTYGNTASNLAQRKLQSFLRLLRISIFGLNISLADALLVWRCAVLWSYRRVVVVTSVFLIIIEIALGLAVITTEVREHQIALREVWPNPLPAEYHQESIIVGRVNKAHYITMLLLNLSMTIGIASRIWHVSRTIHKSSGPSVRYSRIAHIILESGILYAILMVLVMITSLVPSVGQVTRNIFLLVLYYAVGMIPTIVTVLVTLSKTTEYVSQVSDTHTTRVVFAPGPEEFRLSVDTTTAESDPDVKAKAGI
ncbi:hypothetical protein NEOLEDRAFT_1179953 [Neolentinus lepideus HHB14362 ss-1]|uniref:Uncharacterized protein n=1 Tax=Neolentinus lepideus HHB14362 ss-1 TaxID=1314782 RepID=A0A165R9L7_9AGAM|nr:hypothetical protein NEOLEDRAFT_1179953 [Neolentinus lepideus HHB14362 ss-1]